MGIKQAKRESDLSKGIQKDYDILVSKIPLRLNQEQHDLVDRLREESARLWNDILDIHWWLWCSYQVWSTESQMKKLFNGKTHKQRIAESKCVRTFDSGVAPLTGPRDGVKPSRDELE